MATDVLFIGWNRAVAGREAIAMEGFQSALGFLGKQQGTGQIESFEPVMLFAHGGDMNGFILVRGEKAKLDALQRNPEWMEINFRANWYMQGFGVVPGVINEGLQNAMALFQKIISAQ